MIRAPSGSSPGRKRRTPKSHVSAVAILGAVDEGYGKHITHNATGAIAAVLGDCGVPCEIMRGFAARVALSSHSVAAMSLALGSGIA